VGINKNLDRKQEWLCLLWWIDSLQYWFETNLWICSV